MSAEGSQLGRALQLLAVLQARSNVPASHLAQRLGVTTRTVRRDVERLRTLGYQVRSAAGPGGGYALVSGPDVPLLALEPEEAEAVVLALSHAADTGLTGLDEPILTALLKIRRTMRPADAARAERIRSNTAVIGGVEHQLPFGEVAELAEAAATRRTVSFTYCTRDGTESTRRADPCGVIAFARRWYLFCWCHLRQDWRAFRIDRIRDLHVTTFGFAERESPDPRTYVKDAVLRAPYPVVARVVAAASVSRLREVLPSSAADVEPLPVSEGGHDRTLITVGAADVSFMALHLALLDCPLEVIEPASLAEELRRLGDRLSQVTLAGSAEREVERLPRPAGR